MNVNLGGSIKPGQYTREMKICLYNVFYMNVTLLFIIAKKMKTTQMSINR